MRVLPVLIVLAACTEYQLSKPADVPSGEDTAEPPPPEDTEPPLPVLQTDSFPLEDDNGVDLLFFGDTSGSMAVELGLMGEQISEVIGALAVYTSEWHLLAVTGPTGCGVNGVLTPETEGWADLFATGLMTPPGEDEVDEWGLYNAWMAVEESVEGGCNDGFLRDEARLHVIFISDEEDHSPGWDAGDPMYWETYADPILATKANPEDVTFSAIVGPLPEGCDGALPGLGYADATMATSGALISICDAWYTELDLLVALTVQHPSFPLTATPIPETIAVAVNGTERALGWAYVPADNEVVFSIEIPVTGDLVEITYEVAD